MTDSDAISTSSFQIPSLDLELETDLVGKKATSNMFSYMKKRKRISLKTKLEILKRLESNEKVCDICRMYGLASSTVCTINAQSGIIKAKAALISRKRAKYIKQFPRKRSLAMVSMEKLLCSWIELQNELNVPLSRSIIKQQARVIFDELKLKGCCDEGETFIGSAGWYNRFKIRNNIGYNAEEDDEVELQNINEPLVCDCVHLQQVIEEGGYSSHQVFTVSETGFLWKSLPKKLSIISKETDNINIYDHLSLVLACNAAGDMKLKPLVVYTDETPEALLGYAKTKLPVIWRANKSAVVTKDLFEEWFTFYFCPAVKHYCARKNISHKALLVVDNAVCHPTHLNRISDYVKVEFLPDNSTLFQPMNQGILFKFKAHYLQTSILHLLGVDSNESISACQIWQGFNILNAIDYIAKSWNELDLVTINAAWRTIWPDCVSSNDNGHESVSDVLKKLVNSMRETGFIDIEEQDIVEWLDSHELSITIDERVSFMDTDIPLEFEQEPPLRELNLACLDKANELIESALDIYSQRDPNRERSIEVTNNVRKAIQCYRDLHIEKQKRDAQSLLKQHFCATPASTADLQKQSNSLIKIIKKDIILDCCDLKVEMNDVNPIYTINF